ncbi:interleukin-2 receptor subunit beta [Spea bombifrons]|uniref:interleukin-2 receptor subunit beta n=1 Tax=Spea bombifrons TaxID=233779 RepID=UPI00234AE037|nr:interleukin-2 receptor subunit beta [Spea bombifrons]
MSYPALNSEAVHTAAEPGRTGLRDRTAGLLQAQVRLDPPQSLVISLTKDGLWNLTWSSSYSYYIGNNVEYEVVYKPSKDPWLEAKRIPIRQNDLWVCLQSLQPGTLYEAWVRVNQMEFQGGRWSDFSQPLQWRTLPKYSTYSTSKIMQVVLPCTAALIFIILLPLIICSSHRVKKIFWVHVPDPSRFFDPLIFTHKGDFQKWLSTPFDFSAFSLEPTPINISPVDISWHKDKYPPKVLPLGINETLTDSSGQSFSSFSNQGYFFFQFPNITEDDASSDTQPSYGCLEQRDISPMLQNLPLPSTVTCEGTPLFCADYLSDPMSVGIGIQNRSFEIDSMVNLPQSSTLKQMVKEKVSRDLPEVPCCPTGEDKCEMKERGECDNLNTAAQVITEHVQPSSHEIDMTGGYFTLNAFYQQHYSNWV